MRVKDLNGIVHDLIYVYKENLIEKNGYLEMFEDLYKGKMDKIPQKILEMEIETIGAMKSGIVDIRVK